MDQPVTIPETVRDLDMKLVYNAFTTKLDGVENPQEFYKGFLERLPMYRKELGEVLDYWQKAAVKLDVSMASVTEKVGKIADLVRQDQPVIHFVVDALRDVCETMAPCAKHCSVLKQAMTEHDGSSVAEAAKQLCALLTQVEFDLLERDSRWVEIKTGVLPDDDGRVDCAEFAKLLKAIRHAKSMTDKLYQECQKGTTEFSALRLELFGALMACSAAHSKCQEVTRKSELKHLYMTLHTRHLTDLLWTSVFTNKSIAAVVSKRIDGIAKELMHDGVACAGFHRAELRKYLMREHGLKRATQSPFLVDARCRPLLTEDNSQLRESARAWLAERDFEASAREYATRQHLQLKALEQELVALQELWPSWEALAGQLGVKYDGQVTLAKLDSLPTQGTKDMGPAQLRKAVKVWKQRARYLAELASSTMLDCCWALLRATREAAAENPALAYKQDEIAALARQFEVRIGLAGQLGSASSVHLRCQAIVEELELQGKMVEAWLQQNPSGIETDGACSDMAGKVNQSNTW